MESEKTLGQQRTRISFNPSKESIVDFFKEKAAELIDTVDRMAVNPKWNDNQIREFSRLKAMAMTDFESACGWAVKAATL